MQVCAAVAAACDGWPSEDSFVLGDIKPSLSWLEHAPCAHTMSCYTRQGLRDMPGAFEPDSAFIPPVANRGSAWRDSAWAAAIGLLP